MPDRRTAIVVGGTRRVGRWVTEALLGEGHLVHAFFLKNHEAAESLTREMARSGHQLETHAVDATDSQRVRAALDQIVSSSNGIDVLVNATGPATSGPIASTSSRQLEQLWRSNLLTVHNVVTAALPHLPPGGGRIVNFISAGVDTGKAFRQLPLYAACKTMLLSYSRSLARELAPSRITVNCIALGITELPAEGVAAHGIEHLPTDQPVAQRDVAEAIRYLIGPAGDQVTGTVLNLGGGFGL